MLKPDGDVDGVKRVLFHGKILERVDEIRRFYGGLLRDDYKDEALAEMMLRDTCSILYFMKFLQGDDEEIQNHVTRHLGAFEMGLMSFDIKRLENQIPWWLLNEDEGEALIHTYLVSGSDLRHVPWEREPLHQLEALRNIYTDEAINEDNTNNADDSTFTFTWWRRKKKSMIELLPLHRPFRSVTELKAQGIYFKQTRSFNDVRFNSHSFYGTLHIPFLFIHGGTMIHLSNIIALEMTPGYLRKESIVTSYVNFMKSLLEKPNDVKEGRDASSIYDDVKTRINEHCSSKAKTWMAELVNTYFRSPWTAVALVAATLLLCLTFLQTYFTVNPRNSGKYIRHVTSSHFFVFVCVFWMFHEINLRLNYIKNHNL